MMQMGNGPGFRPFGESGFSMAAGMAMLCCGIFYFGGLAQAACSPGLLWDGFGSRGGS